VHISSQNFIKNPLETFEVGEAVTAETSIEYKIVNGKVSQKLYQKLTIQPHANMKFGPPELPDYKMEIEPLAQKNFRWNGRPAEGGCCYWLCRSLVIG